MKKALLTLILSAIVSATFAQWTTGTNINNTNTGNVGIGTTTPAGKLHVQQGSYDFLTTATSIDLGLNGITGGWARAFRIVNSSGSNGQDGGAFGVRGLGTTVNYAYMAIPTSSDVLGYSSTKILVLDNSGNVGVGTTGPNTRLMVVGTGTNSNGVINIQSSDAGARGTLMRTGFYGYTSQDNSGNYFQAWGMRLNGADNLWYRAYTAANNYLPYTELTTGGTIVFGGAVSNLTTDANPTLNPVMTVNVGATPSVAIGTTDPKTYMLAVNGSAIATSMTVKLNANWPDYVFKSDYRLPALSEVKAYIDQNHHLPDMPSEQEVADKGLNLGEINKQLTKKVEELTLYLIEKDRKVKEQEARISKLEEQMQLLISAH